MFVPDQRRDQREIEHVLQVSEDQVACGQLLVVRGELLCKQPIHRFCVAGCDTLALSRDELIL